MKIVLNLINGEKIKIDEDTYITAQKAASSRFDNDGDAYYLEDIFSGHFDDGRAYDATDADEVAQIEGLIGVSDWIGFGENSNTLIKTSAILSITRE